MLNYQNSTAGIALEQQLQQSQQAASAVATSVVSSTIVAAIIAPNGPLNFLAKIEILSMTIVIEANFHPAFFLILSWVRKLSILSPDNIPSNFFRFKFRCVHEKHFGNGEGAVGGGDPESADEL